MHIGEIENSIKNTMENIKFQKSRIENLKNYQPLDEEDKKLTESEIKDSYAIIKGYEEYIKILEDEKSKLKI